MRTNEVGLTLGNGDTIRETVDHSSCVLTEDLAGCIAEGVMVMLNDQLIRNYLSS